MESLATEIREYLIEIGDRCGGHLASNLGVVELTIVLHSLLESPRDKITWDTLYKISQKTFVDETESSKKTSAGAGLTDND